MKSKLLVLSTLFVATNVAAEINFEECLTTLKACTNTTENNSDARNACFDPVVELYNRIHPKVKTDAAELTAVIAESLTASKKAAVEEGHAKQEETNAADACCPYQQNLMPSETVNLPGTGM